MKNLIKEQLQKKADKIKKQMKTLNEEIAILYKQAEQKAIEHDELYKEKEQIKEYIENEKLIDYILEITGLD